MSRSARKGASRAGTMRRIVAELVRQGWRVDKRGHQYRCFPPDGSLPPVFVATTPTDHRSIRNTLRDLSHSGADVDKLPKS